MKGFANFADQDIRLNLVITHSTPHIESISVGFLL